MGAGAKYPSMAIRDSGIGTKVLKPAFMDPGSALIDPGPDAADFGVVVGDPGTSNRV